MKKTHAVWALVLGLLVLAGCQTPPSAVQEVDPLYVREHLVFREDGFMDGRTGWIFPQTLTGKLVANQAWEIDSTLIGLEYANADELVDLSTVPLPVSEEAVEAGTVSVMAYPLGYAIAGHPDTPSIGIIPSLMGLGYGHTKVIDEFWGYHDKLEANGYHLWKLAKLADKSAPGRVFQSLLVLKKLSEEKSDALVVTVGKVEDVYILITIRRFVRTREDVDQFGDWAYAVLKRMGLTAQVEN